MGQRQSEIIKNHMEVYWHDYASASKGVPITEAGLVEKASVIGRTGLMLYDTINPVLLQEKQGTTFLL